MPRTRIGAMVKASWPLLALIGLSVAVRAAVWAGLPDLAVSRSGPAVDLYKEALRHHFWAYLFYEHAEPIGLSILHGAMLRVFGDTAFTNGVMVVPAMISGVLTVCLALATAGRLGAHVLVAWPICAVFSIALVPFEVWWYGWTLDHYTLVLVAWFSWALVRRVQDARLRSSVLTAVAGSLLLFIQKVAFAVVPVMIIATAGLMRRGRASHLRRTLIALAGPLAVSAVLIGKNALANGVYAPSSLTGPNVAVFLYAAKGYSYDRVEAFAERWGAPAWYRWCFQRARELQPSWGPCYGACYMAEDPSSGPFDFEPLVRYAALHGDAILAHLVELDRNRFFERPYLQSFLAQEVSPRFAAVYGAESQRLYRTLAWREPLAFLKQVARAQYIYLVDGWRFLAFLAKDRPGLPYAGVLLAAAGGAFFILMQAYAATFLLGARLLVRWWRHGAGSLAEVDRGVIVLVLGVLVLSGVFSLVCCENGRWFLQSTPYLIPLVAYFVQHVVWPVSAAVVVGVEGRPGRRGRG